MTGGSEPVIVVAKPIVSTEMTVVGEALTTIPPSAMPVVVVVQVVVLVVEVDVEVESARREKVMVTGRRVGAVSRGRRSDMKNSRLNAIT